MCERVEIEVNDIMSKVDTLFLLHCQCELLLSGTELGLGFLVVTLSIAPPSSLNSSNITLYLWRDLECWRAFLSFLAPYLAFGFVCV